MTKAHKKNIISIKKPEMSIKKNIFSKKLILIIILVLFIPIGFIVLKNIVFNSKNKDMEAGGGESEKVANNIQNISLPESFPKDFPVFENSTLMAANSNKDKIEGISAIWETTSTVEEVVSFYQDNLINKGWKADVMSQGEDFVTISVSKVNINGFVAITRGKESKVVISVALGVK